MISILLAVYNGELYLEKSLKSVLDQTYTDFEVLIGFNGTIDKSREIVSSFNDERIKTFEFDWANKPKTLNALIEQSNGEFICIQDDDDIWMPRKLEKQILLMDQFDVVGTQIVYINETDDIIGGPNLAVNHDDIVFKCMNADNQIASTAAMIKKESILSVGKWNEDRQGIEDFDLWLKIIKSKYKFHNIPKVFVWHRLHTKSNFNTKKFDIEGLVKEYK